MKLDYKEEKAMEVTRYREQLFETAKAIFSVDSPSGYTRNVIDLIRSMTEELGYRFEITRKGCGVITVEGRDNNKTVGMSAHVDTLGRWCVPSPPTGS